MPQYDFRCEICRGRFGLHFKSIADYAKAVPRCPDCDSTELTRVIKSAAIPKSQRDYRKMSSGEMLSVLESGEKRQVEEMFRQVNSSAGDETASD